MTENEARLILDVRISRFDHAGDVNEALEIAKQSLKEIQQYREMERKLREVYGDCDGLLERSVNLLCEHSGIDIGDPIKARLLTGEDVDKWDAYREISTVEECRKAVEKQKPKKPIPINYKEYIDKISNAEFLEDAFWCPSCKTYLRSGKYCNGCGQKLDWNENLEGREDDSDKHIL